MARSKQFAWTVLALVFLAVSWLWETLAPIVQAVIDLLPLRRLKDWSNRQLERMPAYATLLIFLIPLTSSEMIKLLSFVAFADRQIVAGALIYAFAEVVRFGLASYVWKTCRHKLLSITWVAKLHEWLLAVHHWAERQTAPVRTRLRNALLEAGLSGDRAGLWSRVKALWRYARRRPS